MKKRWFAWGLLVAFLMAQLSVTTLADESGRVAADSRSGVVRIISEFEDYYSLGSGFGIGDVGEETKYFVTNHHVVFETARSSNGSYVNIPAMNVWIMLGDDAWDPVTGLDTSRCIPCEIVYASESGYPDVAIIKAAKKVPDRVALPLMDDDSLLEAGDTVYALGYPSNSDYTEQTSRGEYLVADIEDVTITRGVVSRFTNSSTFGNTEIIQHDAKINHGNSGGPLINETGLVVGINTYGFGQDVSSGDSQNFASVHIREVRDILDDLEIDYDTEDDLEKNEEEKKSSILVIVLVVVGVLAAGAVAVVVLMKRKQAASGRNEYHEPAEKAFEVVPTASVQAPEEPDTRPRLQGLSGCFAGQRFTIDGSVRIGRDPSKNDLVYPMDTNGVSGVHCMVTVAEGMIWLKDLGSTYGTFLSGGRRLAAGEAVQVRIGDQFWLGTEKELYVIAPKGGI